MSKTRKVDFEDLVHQEMLSMADTMCKDYCKYHEQYMKDQAEFDDENPTYLKHCTKCPMNQFYH